MKMQRHRPFAGVTERLPSTPRCPYCNALLDAVSNLAAKRGPKPGSVTVCAYCTKVLRFTDDMGLRKVDQAELEDIFRQAPNFAASVRDLQRAVRQRPPPARRDDGRSM